MADSENGDALRKQKQQRQALETLQEVRDRVSKRNTDLTAEQIEEIADRFSRDVIQGLVDKGKGRFEH